MNGLFGGKVEKFLLLRTIDMLMYNLTLQHRGALCNNTHRHLTMKPSVGATPTSIEKTRERVPHVFQCIYQLRAYKGIL